MKKEDVDGCLKIGNRLREVGLGIPRVVEILEGDESAEAVAFVAKYKSISTSDLAYLSIEEICLASEITTRRLWEVIAGARLEQSQEAVKLLAADNHVRVVQTIIRNATESIPIVGGEGEVVGWHHGDIKAQELFAKATGFLPTPKGSQTIINVAQQNNSPLPIDDDDEVGDMRLPDADEFYKDLQTSMARPQLEAPKPVESVPEVLTPEYVDVR